MADGTYGPSPAELGLAEEDLGLKSPELNYSGTSLIEYVTQTGQLPPDITPAQLNDLNKQMTQEQILAYYKVIKRTEDPQKRETLIKEWVPKPHQMYHSSPDGNIQEFTPRLSHRSTDEPDSVFAAPSKSVSAIFMSPNLKSTKSGTYDGGETYKVIVGNPAEFLASDRDGYMYTLPGESFEADPNTGLGFSEWTSTTPVKPTGVKHYPSAIQAMIDSGIQIVPASMEIIKELDKPDSDKPAVIKGLKAIKSIEELKQMLL